MGRLKEGMGTFIGANGTVCESDRMPTRVVVPVDVPYFVMPGRTNDTAMAACCHPQPLDLIDNCYVWCELPSQLYANRSDAPSEATLGASFADCLVANGHTSPEIYRLRLKSSAAPASSVGPRAGLWVLLIASLTYW